MSGEGEDQPSSENAQISIKPIIKVKRPSQENEEEGDWTGDDNNESGGLKSRPKRHSNVGSVNSTNTTTSSFIFGPLHTKLTPELNKRVRFFDRLSWRSISNIKVPSSNVSLPKMMAEYYESDLSLEDPNDLPGFANLFYCSEITVAEPCCSCCDRNIYTICEGHDGNILYHAEKKVDSGCSVCIKWLCPWKLNFTRVGFEISLYRPTLALNGTKLLTYKRKMHWLANELDACETFYTLGIEKYYLGKVEKTSEGYNVLDRKGTELYGVVRSKETLIVTSKHGVLSDAIIQCSNKSLCRTFHKYQHTISWMHENIDITTKILLIGVLLLELNSDEKYVELPRANEGVYPSNIPDG